MTGEVIIEIMGGVAEVTKKSKGVSVTIIDHDTYDENGEIPAETEYEANDEI